MGEHTAIQWCDHTFNPWRGCAKVSPGCDHCYAEAGAKRNPKILGVWGEDGTRVVASEAMWREPLRWNAVAERAGTRARVFCASLADVAEDRSDLLAPRLRLCRLIEQTPGLIWMLLTKRPENLARLFSREILERCGVGTTTEDQPRADERIPQLLATPAGWHFISAEPLLGRLDIEPFLWDEDDRHDALCGLDWVIVGGESGHGARPMDLAWARRIAHHCYGAGVPVFIKQLGAQPTGWWGDDSPRRIGPLHDKKGGDPAEWPADLRVREFPVPA